MNFSFVELDLKNKYGYVVTDVFNDKMLGIYQANETLSLSVYPMDVIMLHCVILT